MAINIDLLELQTLNNTSILSQINQNNNTIQTALTDSLSLSGQSPNQMLSNLDMNNSQIINLPAPATLNSPARLVDVASNPTITVPPTGTSGGTVPFLNGTNIWSGINTYSGGGGIAFTQTGSGAVTRTLDAKVKEYAVSVIDFGADSTGVADSTTAIQDAINSLSSSGGEVLFPIGTYKISSTLTIGNGTNAAASTKMGVVLRGVGNNLTQPVFPGYTATTGPILSWAGGAASMVSINGPLFGWGVQNLYFNGNSVANSVGITINSASGGDCKNLTLVNCGRGIASTTYALFGSFTNTNSWGNKFYGINIQVPAISGAMGILLTGGAANSNTFLNTFTNTDIFLPTSVVTVYGVYLQMCDSNVFMNTHVYGGNPSATSVNFDYSAFAGFPNSNFFYLLDPFQSGGGTSFQIAGTAPTGVTQSNIVHLCPENGAVDPGLPNLVCYTPNTSVVTSPPPTAKTTNYTMTGSDSSLIFNGASTLTLTLLAAVNCPGRWLRIKTIANQSVVSNTNNVVPLIGGAAGTAILSNTAGKWASLQSDGTNWHIMESN